MNDENLTKCIQTLKHMYYDISIEGQNCPNEAEFRAYDILMKINDGGMLSSYKLSIEPVFILEKNYLFSDTLRSIQTLDPYVRTSTEVTFAIKVLTAVNTNNYVKFFKLVRQATLLQVLHTYLC